MAQAWDEKAVFSTALGLAGAEREAYLQEACPDAASRERIESLLRHHAAAQEVFPEEPDTAAAPAPRSQIAEFRILHRLGSGAMGVVYLAEDTVLGRKVALKILAAHLTGSEHALARFRAEARSAAALRHPAIVPVFKFDEDEGVHYIVSEFVDGPTLADIIAERKKVGFGEGGSEDARTWHRRAAEIVSTIADALDCAHRAQIVHRDVKPSNILMDPQGGPRLTDFGVAKHLTEESRSLQTGLVGTAYYMSPEQASIAGTRVDQRSDIFSLGVVLYELLTLRRPFEGGNAQLILRAVIECNPTRVRALDNSIHKDLETICHKALERKPEWRYQTAAHVAADLRCVLAGVPILARRTSLVRRGRRWLAIHRRGAIAATTIVLACVVGILGWTIYHMRSETLAWFTVDAPGRQTAVYLQQVDARSLEPQPPVALGFTPLGPKAVPLGAYRVTVATTDSTAFAEFNVLFAEPGRDRSTSFLVTDDWRNGGTGKKADPASPRALKARLTATATAVSGMGYVPAGEYHFGWMDDDHPTTGRRKPVLPAFYMDYAEVSNEQYKKFCDDSGHPQPYCWTEFGYPAFVADAPVVCVTWQDAEAYARWTGKRLPTMFEWQAAARGLEGHVYPDGANGPPPEIRELETDDLRRAQSSEGEILFRAMREFTRGVSAGAADSRGFHHFCSNVRELSGTVDPASQSVVILGRCWHDPAEHDLRKVLTGSVESTSFSHGFRCAKSAAPFQSIKMKGDTNAKLPNSEP